MTIGHSAYLIHDETIHDFIAAADEASFRFEAQPEKVAAQLCHLFGELCVLEVSKLLGLHRVASL